MFIFPPGTFEFLRKRRERREEYSTMNRATLILFSLIVSTTPFVIARSIADQQPALQPKLEGCISCHGLIEPMHKYGTTETLDKLKDGKDAVGLSCTGCHGGNPVPTKTSNDPQDIERVKKLAHVQPRLPETWRRNG